MIVDELIAVLGYDLRGEGDLRKFNQGIKNTERRLAAFAAAATRYGAIAGAALGAGVVFLGKSIISTNAQFEKFHATLEILEGSSAKADASFAWIKTFAKSTPFEVAEVTDAFVRLRSYGIDPTNGTLQSVGDAASAMGKTLGEGVEALADAATNEFERLKQFGVTASVAGDQVAFSWQENGKTVTKSVKKNGQEITAFLVGNFNRFRGAMDKQSRTWNGIVSNLSDTWTDFLFQIGQAGMFQFAIDQGNALLEWTKANGDTIKEWAGNISAAFIAISKAVGFIAGRIMKDGKAIIDFFSKMDPAIFYAVAAAFGLLAIYLFPVTWALAAIVVALDDIAEWWSGGHSRFGDFIAWIQEMTGASQQLATALAAVAAALALIAGIKVFSLLKAVGNLFTGIGTGVMAGVKETPIPKGGWMNALGLTGVMGFFGTLVEGMGDTPGDTFEQQVANQKKAREALQKGLGLGGRPQTTGGPARYRATGPVDPYGGVFKGNANSPEGVNQGTAGFAGMLTNMNANLARLSANAAPGATITDARVDSRSYPVTVAANTTINVTQAAAAGAAAVGAVSAAVGQAAVSAASRIEAGPSEP